ncbi:MAG: transpeptidase family protein [Chitinophagales bacterium]|nr:transpeptidase family protein [Chitinophagales bacterium]
MKVKTNILLRIYVLYALMIISGLAVLWKVYSIQHYKDRYWLKKAEETTTRWFDIYPERGNIYTAKGDLLATSMPYYNLYIDFASAAMTDKIFESNVDSLAYYMATYFGKQSKSQYERDLSVARNAKKRGFLLRRNVTYAELREIKKWPLFREGKYKGGLVVEERLSRKNPYGTLAQRAIGIYSKDRNAVGLEAAYNNFLGGVKGAEFKQKVSNNIWIPIQNEGTVKAQSGVDIVTTLDINLQDVAENALRRALDSSQADFGCVVMMEVKTGAIKVMANMGKRSDGQYDEIQNYAVAHRSEPGSTFKAVSYLMLFDKYHLKLNDTVNIGNGSAINFHGRILRESHALPPRINVRDAFSISSNLTAAKLIDDNFKNDRNGFYKNLQRYGLTEVSGIDLAGESKPGVKKPETWSNTSLPWKAIGYEQTFSPLQILTFYNTIANGGYRVKPYLVSRIEKNGEVIKETHPKVSNVKIASDYALNSIKELMRYVVEGPKGTARSIKSDYVSIAGKTGTAKIFDPKIGKYTNDNQAMFCGFFPIENPQYSCIVMIYRPHGARRQGGNIAGPIFKELAEKSMTTNLSVAHEFVIPSEEKPEMITEVKGNVAQVKTILDRYHIHTDLSDNVSYADIKVKNAGLAIKAMPISETKIPDLKGMNLDDAFVLLENMGLRVKFNGLGKVSGQSILPGIKAKKGDEIILTLEI